MMSEETVRRRGRLGATLLVASLLTPLYAQDRTAWRDPSPHTVNSANDRRRRSTGSARLGRLRSAPGLIGGRRQHGARIRRFRSKAGGKFPCLWHYAPWVRRVHLCRPGGRGESPGSGRVGGDRCAETRPASAGRALVRRRGIECGRQFSPEIGSPGWCTSKPDTSYAFDNGKGAKMEELMALQARQPPPPAAGPSDLVSFGGLARMARTTRWIPDTRGGAQADLGIDR